MLRIAGLDAADKPMEDECSVVITVFGNVTMTFSPPKAAEGEREYIHPSGEDQWWVYFTLAVACYRTAESDPELRIVPDAGIEHNYLSHVRAHFQRTAVVMRNRQISQPVQNLSKPSLLYRPIESMH